MSKILNEIATNSISLNECLQRLLIISNKTGNQELSDWCMKELMGYKSKEKLPEYRKFKSLNILYSGINGRFQITNQPLQPGYLKDETLKQLEPVSLYESIAEIEKRKDEESPLSRDITFLSGEVFRNTKDEYTGMGVQCTSIRQVIPQQFYGEIYSAVKTRIINLLCYYESKNVDLDNLDVSIKSDEEENVKVFNQIVLEGQSFASQKKEKKILWNVLIPIFTAIAGGVISGVLVYLITNVWMR